MASPTPPRLAEWLLTRLLGSRASAPYIVADLREEFDSQGAERPTTARLWYWAQSLGVGLRLSLARSGAPEPEPARTPPRGDRMRNELGLAVRSLIKRPVLSTAVVLTVGGALAVATIGFSLVDGVLLRPLPYATPDRLVTIWERATERNRERNPTSPANFYAWSDGLKQVEGLTALMETSTPLTGEGDPDQVGVVYTSGGVFPLLGAVPLAGRLFGGADDVEGGPDIVVISEGLWRRRYGADSGLIGRSIQVNGRARQVIGVLPARFDFAPGFSWASVGSRDLYIPFQYGADARTFGGRFLQVIGRLAPGATIESARQEASTLAARLRETFPERQKGWDINLVGLHADIVGEVRTPIAIVFGAVCFVLLIACANVANLLMARATERRGEMAIRSALGAGRIALARQLFGESLLLAGLGGLVGVLLSAWGTAALIRANPDLPRLDAVGLDGGALGFALLATALTACLIGVGPAVAASGGPLAGWFTQRGAVGDLRAGRARRSLVGVQVALSVVLLMGTGLLIRSLLNRLRVDLGIDTANVLTAQVSLPTRTFPKPEQRSTALEGLLSRVAAMPGVEAASASSIVPMSDQGQATSFQALDRPRPEAGKFPTADVRFVHHEFFATMRVPLLAGRFLQESDRLGAVTAVVINETGARQMWPAESAVGQRIQMEWGDTLIANVVGVVGDVRLTGPDKPVDRATLYWDYRQTGTPGDMVLVVRGKQTAPSIGPIRSALAEIDPSLPLYNVRTMSGLKALAVAQSRFITAALSMFSLLALGLAALGIYGVMAYAVQQRTREIGVRLALGADRRTVVWMLLREGGRMVVPALAIGIVAALLLSGVLRSLVFGVTPYDPLALGAGLGTIGIVALGACWIPARRASAIPPVEAIRAD